MPAFDEMRKASPLHGRAGVAGGGIAIAERPMLGKVIVRGDGADRDFQAAIEAVCGAPAPVEPNTWVEAEGEAGVLCWLVWLGPDEWQVTTAEDGEHAIGLALIEKLAGRHAAVVNVADYYTTIRVSGPKARDLLAKGTPLDLHPRVMRAGQCAQTRLAHATVLIVQIDDAPTYDLQVRWSMAEYLLDWLEDAAKSYL